MMDILKHFHAEGTPAPCSQPDVGTDTVDGKAIYNAELRYVAQSVRRLVRQERKFGCEGGGTIRAYPRHRPEAVQGAVVGSRKPEVKVSRNNEPEVANGATTSFSTILAKFLTTVELDVPRLDLSSILEGAAYLKEWFDAVNTASDLAHEHDCAMSSIAISQIVQTT